MLVILSLMCVLPLLLLVMASFTDEAVLTANGYSFFPEKFSLGSYQYIFRASQTVFRAYGMTFFITIVGTICNVVFTIGFLSAVPSRAEGPQRHCVFGVLHHAV